MSVRRYLGRTLLWILPVCFIAVVLLAVWFGVNEIHAYTAKTTQLSPDELKTRLDDLKWLLSALIATAGFFTIAQAAAAFFNAQTFTKQSEDAIKRIQDLAKDAEARYPIFARTEEIRRQAYRSLALSLEDEGYDWRDSLYERMTLRERQKLLSVERFIGVEFLSHLDGEEAYARNLRRLANFYASKYKYEYARQAAYLGDLEHAAYYLELARDLTGDAFYLLTDLGLLYSEFFSKSVSNRVQRDKYMSIARECFNSSLKKQPHQERAHYNLAVAADDEGELLQAVKHSEDALALDPAVWEFRVIPEMHGNVIYNLACYCAKLSYPDTQGQLRADAAQWRERALQRLREAADIGQVMEDTVTGDYEKRDLQQLVAYADPQLKRELELLRPRLSANRGKRPAPPISWRTRLSGAWKALTGKSSTDPGSSQS